MNRRWLSRATLHTLVREHHMTPALATRRFLLSAVGALLLLASAFGTRSALPATPSRSALRLLHSQVPRADWRAAVRSFAEEHLQHTAWGPAHARRDYEVTLQLARAEGLAVDDDALYAAAYLHDMGGLPPYAKTGVDHGERSAQLVDSVLRGTGFPMQKVPLVQELVSHHQYYRPPDTLRVAVLFRDADILDFMGAIDVARIISLTKREKFVPDLPQAIEVLQKQMVDMPKLLQSDAAKREGERRTAEMKAFLDALSAETDSLKVI